MSTYLEITPTELSGTYFYIGMYRICCKNALLWLDVTLINKVSLNITLQLNTCFRFPTLNHGLVVHISLLFVALIFDLYFLLSRVFALQGTISVHSDM